MCLGLERVLWDAKEGKHLALQLGQLQLEDLDSVPVLEQMVALGQAEQAQHLLGGGMCALALLGVDRKLVDALAGHGLTQLALDRPIEAYDRSIDTLVSKLRRKLESAGVPAACIGSVRGQGYVLDPPAAAPG